MKAMRCGSGQGANHTDTAWYREDLQRRHGLKGALSCAPICVTGHPGLTMELRRLVLLLPFALLVACTAASTPLLRLAPAALERTLSLHQQLGVEAGTRSERVEVLLEADANVVRLAVVALGRTAARLEWDGVTLRHTKAAWWPGSVQPERVLSDLQLVWWPAAAVRQALPLGWSLEANDRQRVLRHGARDIVTVSYASAGNVELVHHRENYRLHIESRPALELGGAPGLLQQGRPVRRDGIAHRTCMHE
jgi:hypothetical protein